MLCNTNILIDIVQSHMIPVVGYKNTVKKAERWLELARLLDCLKHFKTIDITFFITQI